MRTLVLFIVTIAATFSTDAQSDNKIVIGKIDSVYSKILNEKRKIWIYTPGMTSGAKDSGQHYPVLYLLDGDSHFASVVGMIQQMSQANGNSVYPEMIVVAIPNTNRTRDLTPTHIASDTPMMDSNFSKTTGGGENFISFIEKELMPHIDSVYPTAPYKLLVGHSFGGLTVMNVLANHTKMFNAYIAIDPSMWYDRQRFLSATEKKLADKKYDGVRLYVGIANTMPDGMTLAQMKKDTSSDTRHIRSIFELDKFLRANTQNGLKYASRYYSDDNHGSVPMASEYDGLRFIFNYYRLNITGKDYRDTSNLIVSKYKKHYDLLSKEMGYKVTPPELYINYLGYDAMSNMQYAKAAGFFKMNIDNNPKSANVYDSYADLLAAQKDTANAIVNYKKSLALSDNADTRRKLDALEGREIFKLPSGELQKYTGVFVLDNMSIDVTIVLKDDDLWAQVAGQVDYQLVPVAPDTFTVKNMNGYEVIFHKEGDKVIGFTSVQPNGTFEAHVKK
ncbi:MAG: alpha/beta hydrolase-fold protein [Ginsengibacter sp.]